MLAAVAAAQDDELPSLRVVSAPQVLADTACRKSTVNDTFGNLPKVTAAPSLIPESDQPARL